MITLLFDIDDTLYDMNWPFEAAYKELFGERNYPLLVSELCIANRKHSDEIYEASMRGDISMKDMQIYRIREAFKDFDITISSEEAWNFQKTYEGKQQEIHLSTDLRKMFESCAQHAEEVNLGIITNGPVNHQLRKVSNLELNHWIPREHMIISSSIGVAKPDSRIFKATIKALKLPEISSESSMKIFYIGDSFENDMLGAKNAGLLSIWMNRRNRPLPNANYIPNYTVHSERELLSLVLTLISKYC